MGTWRVPRENSLDHEQNVVRENLVLEKWRAKGSKISPCLKFCFPLFEYVSMLPQGTRTLRYTLNVSHFQRPGPRIYASGSVKPKSAAKLAAPMRKLWGLKWLLSSPKKVVRKWFKALEKWWVLTLVPSTKVNNGPDREPRRVQKLFNAWTGQCYYRSPVVVEYGYKMDASSGCLKLVRVSLAATTAPLRRRKLALPRCKNLENEKKR